MDGPTESEGYYVSEFSDFVGMMLSRAAQAVCDPNHATGKAFVRPVKMWFTTNNAERHRGL